MENTKKSIFINKLTTYLFYISIFIFLVAFNFQDSKTGGWVQQFLPNLPGNPPLLDITFADSTVGYAIAMKTGFQDTSYILKTTNSGNNWFIQKMITSEYSGLNRLFILNKDTLFIASYIGTAGNISYMIRTTNGGINWQSYSWPTTAEPSDLFVLNLDTIWMCGPSGSSGGLFRTTNGGLNWQLQYVGVSTSNPNKIYMYNSRIGFMSAGGSFLKTTNSGVNWTVITGENDYTDIYFIDSLKGYKAKTEIKKTTNGGLNWQAIYLPTVQGGVQTYKIINKFSRYNDTIYGAGGIVRFPNIQSRALVFKSTNNGTSFGYQIPDTSYKYFQFNYTKFVTGKIGWANDDYSGIHTIVGGDSTFFTGIINNSEPISKNFLLFQNYPNPFNQCTIINVQLQIAKNIKLNIYDISGKLIKALINQKESSGTHSYKFDGGNLSSGIYLYTLFVDGNILDTKKAVIIK